MAPLAFRMLIAGAFVVNPCLGEFVHLNFLSLRSCDSSGGRFCSPGTFCLSRLIHVKNICIITLYILKRSFVNDYPRTLKGCQNPKRGPRVTASSHKFSRRPTKSRAFRDSLSCRTVPTAAATLCRSPVVHLKTRTPSGRQ